GGSGEETGREILRAFFGSADGQVRFLGTAPGGLASTRPVLEVWLARRGAGGRDAGDTGRVRWLPFDELLAAAGSPALRDPRTLAALALAARSDILAEVFMVRVGPLKRAAASGGPVEEELHAIAIRVRALLERQARCFRDVCLPALAAHGVRILRWSDVSAAQQEVLRRSFTEEVF